MTSCIYNKKMVKLISIFKIKESNFMLIYKLSIYFIVVS